MDNVQPGMSIIDAIQNLRIISKKFKSAKKDLRLVFINLEKTFDSVPHALRSQGVPETYIQLIIDMYRGVITTIRCNARISKDFPKKIGVPTSRICT